MKLLKDKNTIRPEGDYMALFEIYLLFSFNIEDVKIYVQYFTSDITLNGKIMLL